MPVGSREEARQIVRAVLAADFACDELAFVDDQISIFPAEERPGRRRFPFAPEKRLGIATMGAGVVVSCDPDWIGWLSRALGQLRRDEIFSAATIARLVGFVEPSGQVLRGPDLKFVCSAADLRPAPVPDGIEIVAVEGTEILHLYGYPGFRNALSYQIETPRPDMLATVARDGIEIVGIAGASADCDAMWQIGVDVAGTARGHGIGRALVSQLTQEVHRLGRLPYYSTRVSNIPSSSLAISVGYWPAWIEMYAIAG